MAKLGLQAAAELTGRSRSTIHRAMQQGRLSYEKDESGGRLVDTAELLRVFGESPPEDARNGAGNGERHAMHNVELRAKLELERAKNALLEERIAELKDERDRWREQASRLLTDQRPARRRRWWPWG
jgi:hypothetical protein